jgi:thiol-disulfide isomerase/thioredoxin
MKTLISIFISLFPGMMLSQAVNEGLQQKDPFLNSVSKIFCHDDFSYESISKVKSLFDLDTAYSMANVRIHKYGDSIIFINIVSNDRENELLLINDSVWAVQHSLKEMHFIGNGIKGIEGNSLSLHFPASIFTVDTSIFRATPFWKIIGSEGDYDLVSLDITNKPREVSQMRVELLINKSDSLIYGVVQEASFTGLISSHYQQQTLKNYTFYSNKEVYLPPYMHCYNRITTVMTKAAEPMEQQMQDTIQNDEYLKDPVLFDLQGNMVSLPKEGLIFFDLFYAGCFPCMKSAPVIEKIYQDYKDDIHFYGLDEVDSDITKITRYKNQMGITFPLLTGGNDKISDKLFENGGYPLFFLLDARKGKILWKHQGFSENLESIITDAINLNK